MEKSTHARVQENLPTYFHMHQMESKRKGFPTESYILSHYMTRKYHNIVSCSAFLSRIWKIFLVLLRTISPELQPYLTIDVWFIRFFWIENNNKIYIVNTITDIYQTGKRQILLKIATYQYPWTSTTTLWWSRLLSLTLVTHIS